MYTVISRQIVTPQPPACCALLRWAALPLALALLCAGGAAWAQTVTPLRVLERQLGISYDGVVPVTAPIAPVAQDGTPADTASMASAPDAATPAGAQPAAQVPTAQAPTAQDTQDDTQQAKQRAKLEAMRLLVSPGASPASPANASAANQLNQLNQPDASAQVSPANAAFERQLAAIRQALVDEALKGPTRVLSTAWVDQDGRLHEDTQVTNGMQVRGVRVLNYVDGDANTVVARIATDQQQADTPPVPGAPACPAPPDARWAQHVSVLADLAPGIRGEDMHYAVELLAAWRAQWQQASQAQAVRWRQSVHTPMQLSAYQEAVQGGSEQAQGDWQLRQQLRPAPPMATPAVEAPTDQVLDLNGAGAGAARSVSYLNKTPQPAKLTEWQLDLTLTKRGQSQVLWRDSLRLRWAVPELGLVPPSVPPALIDHMLRASAQGVQALNSLMACEPVQFALLSQDGGDIVVGGGSYNGLREGDRLVLVNSRELPKRVLHAGVANRMALAQVAQAGKAQSTLRQVAGPTLTPAPGSAWVAMPY
jgi:hypothetical protein